MSNLSNTESGRLPHPASRDSGRFSSVLPSGRLISSRWSGAPLEHPAGAGTAHIRVRTLRRPWREQPAEESVFNRICPVRARMEGTAGAGIGDGCVGDLQQDYRALAVAGVFVFQCREAAHLGGCVAKVRRRASGERAHRRAPLLEGVCPAPAKTRSRSSGQVPGQGETRSGSPTRSRHCCSRLQLTILRSQSR